MKKVTVELNEETRAKLKEIAKQAYFMDCFLFTVEKFVNELIEEEWQELQKEKEDDI